MEGTAKANGLRGKLHSIKLFYLHLNILEYLFSIEKNLNYACADDMYGFQQRPGVLTQHRPYDFIFHA